MLAAKVNNGNESDTMKKINPSDEFIMMENQRV